jgi:hypothetical protein
MGLSNFPCERAPFGYIYGFRTAIFGNAGFMECR